MQKLKLSIFLSLLLFGSFHDGMSQTVCYATTTTSLTGITQQPCKIYRVRIFVHVLVRNPGNSNDYSTSVATTILNNLNSSYNSQYGIYFDLIGTRYWANNFYASPTTNMLAMQGIETDSGNDFASHSNAINIYVLPKDSQFQAGYVPYSNKQILLIGGIRNVTHCVGGTVAYEIATSKVISHEMGHCFGLIHTFQNSTPYGGDDGLSDTSYDNVTNQSCVNPANCQFAGPCSSCSLSSNPTTTLTNMMSYTVPNCMSVFSQMQLDLMRYNLNNSQSGVVSQSQSGGPNLQNMTRDGGYSVTTVNSISSGYHTVNSNIAPVELTSNMNWVPNTTSVWWGLSGSKNENIWLQPSSGQTIGYSITANNICGSSNRNVTFTVQSGFRIISSNAIKDELVMIFDNVLFIESLPQTIDIFDEKTGRIEKSVDVVKIFEEKQFQKGNEIVLDIKKIPKGVKLIRFNYFNPDIKGDKKEFETKTERVIFIE